MHYDKDSKCVENWNITCSLQVKKISEHLQLQRKNILIYD